MLAEFIVPFEMEKEFMFNPGYAFYGALCARMSEEFNQYVHDENLGISQYVTYDNGHHQGTWHIKVFSDQGEYEITNALQNKDLVIRDNHVHLHPHKETIIPEGEGFGYFMDERLGSGNTFDISFVTPTGFKQSGKNVILPDLRLIYQSIYLKFYKLMNFERDEIDLPACLSESTEILSYRLQSDSFKLKANSRIPGFRGTMKIRLERTEFERYGRFLLAFGEICGVGVKTTLGMGGFSLNPLSSKNTSANSKRI